MHDPFTSVSRPHPPTLTGGRGGSKDQPPRADAIRCINSQMHESARQVLALPFQKMPRWMQSGAADDGSELTLGPAEGVPHQDHGPLWGAPLWQEPWVQIDS